MQLKANIPKPNPGISVYLVREQIEYHWEQGGPDRLMNLATVVKYVYAYEDALDKEKHNSKIYKILFLLALLSGIIMFIAFVTK